MGGFHPAFFAGGTLGQETDLHELTGKPAITFNLRDSRGTTHRLEDYRGKWLLMVFHRHLG